MSRTYRRKNLPLPASYFYTFVIRDDFIGNVPMEPRDAMLKAVRYHSDAGWTWHRMGAAPSWYCNIYERTMRQKAKRELHKFTKNEGHEVLIQARHRRSAAYSWW